MIKIIGNGSFLTAQGTPEAGARFVGTGTPTFWKVRVDEGDPNHHRYVDITSGGMHLLTTRLQYLFPRFHADMSGDGYPPLPELLLNSGLAGMLRTRSGDPNRLDRVTDCTTTPRTSADNNDDVKLFLDSDLR